MYGISGFTNRSSTFACSTTFPPYITITVVGELGDDAEVVGDHHDRHLVLGLQLLHQPQDLRLRGHVERGRRLVGDQDLRVVDQRHRDHHALAHAARELVRVVVDALVGARDLDLLEDVDRLLPRLLLRDVLMDQGRFLELPPDRLHRVQRRHRVLEDHPDRAAADLPHARLARAEHLLALEEHRAPDGRLPRIDEAHHGEERDALPRAGLADDAERLPLVQLEADAGDRLDDAVVRPERGAEVLDFESGSHQLGRIRGSRKP